MHAAARHRLDQPTRDRIRLLLATTPERRVTALLGISRQTLGRLLAGLPVLAGTIALVRERLREIAE